MSNKQLNWDKLPTGVLVGLILIVVLTMFAIYYGIMEHNTKVKPSDNITAEAYEEVVYTSVEEVAENVKDQIKTTADWIAFCQRIDDPAKKKKAGGSSEDVRSIFETVEYDGFQNIKSEDVPTILKELVEQISTDDLDNPLMKDKCYAYVWLTAASFAHTTYLENNFTEGQRVEIADLTSKASKQIASQLSVFVGEPSFTIIMISYAAMFSEEAREALGV